MNKNIDWTIDLDRERAFMCRDLSDMPTTARCIVMYFEKATDIPNNPVGLTGWVTKEETP